MYSLKWYVIISSGIGVFPLIQLSSTTEVKFRTEVIYANYSLKLNENETVLIGGHLE